VQVLSAVKHRDPYLLVLASTVGDTDLRCESTYVLFPDAPAATLHILTDGAHVLGTIERDAERIATSADVGDFLLGDHHQALTQLMRRYWTG
jgi:hypothetical protein